MTKLRHERPHREADPGAVTELREYESPSHWKSPQEREQRAKQLTHEKREQAARAALIREFGRLKGPAKAASQKERRGERLGLFERAAIDRWKAIKKQLGL